MVPPHIWEKASAGKEAQLALVGIFEGHGRTKMVGSAGMMEAILHSIVERSTGPEVMVRSACGDQDQEDNPFRLDKRGHILITNAGKTGSINRRTDG